jgi:amidase
MNAAFRNCIAVLRRVGVAVQRIDIASELGEIAKAANVIATYEGARSHKAHLEKFGTRLEPVIANVVREGLSIPAERYNEAKQRIADAAGRFTNIFASTPVILTPSAVGAAPAGLSSTGDPRMNTPWTALGTPAISVPMAVGDALPLGVQLTADRGQDARLLRAAVLVHQNVSVGSAR